MVSRSTQAMPKALPTDVGVNPRRTGVPVKEPVGNCRNSGNRGP